MEAVKKSFDDYIRDHYYCTNFGAKESLVASKQADFNQRLRPKPARGS
jgi:hypothetical protein